MSTPTPVSQESLALQQYATDRSQPGKAWLGKKLVLVTTGDKQELRYEKVSLLQRIQAFFGRGNANFSDVIKYCAEKGLSCAELKNKMISYQKTGRILPLKVIDSTTSAKMTTLENTRIENLKNFLKDSNYIEKIEALCPTPQELHELSPEDLDKLLILRREPLRTLCNKEVHAVQLFDQARTGELKHSTILSTYTEDRYQKWTAQDAEGNTPLHIIFRQLNTYSNDQISRMHYTIEEIERLKPSERAAILSIQNQEGKTALHLLCEQSQKVEELRGQPNSWLGSNINFFIDETMPELIKGSSAHERKSALASKDKNGNTPLFYAIQNASSPNSPNSAYAVAAAFLKHLKYQEIDNASIRLIGKNHKNNPRNWSAETLFNKVEDKKAGR